MKIDFDGIQAFVMIAELGGFNRAAESLHLTQTALTRRMQKLESYLGLKLLDRTTRHVELTAVGRDFLPQARSMVDEMTRALGQLKDMSKNIHGSFTLACVPTMAGHLLPLLIREYADECPGNRIRLLDARSYQVRDAVLNSQAELGICIQGEHHPSLLEVPLFDDSLMFFQVLRVYFRHNERAAVIHAPLAGVVYHSASAFYGKGGEFFRSASSGGKKGNVHSFERVFLQFLNFDFLPFVSDGFANGAA